MKAATIGLFLVTLTVAALASLCLGKYPLSLHEVTGYLLYQAGAGTMAPDRLPILRNIILEIRLPRIATAILVGSALSASGATYQALFVNPLVSPGLLGVLAGASFGSALGLVLFKGWFAIQVATFLGGVTAVALALFLAGAQRNANVTMLLLGGIVSGALFTSLVSVIKYLADPYNQLPAITYWLMGNLAMADRTTAFATGIPIGAGVLVLMLLSRPLNVLSMGDDEARSLGIDVQRVRMTAIVCATLVSALTVVLAGIIGWVGMIIPHIARMIVGPDNETLIPVAALLGATYLLMVDNISRLLFSFELPIGIATAVVGIPFFMAVLKRTRKGWY
ncbi:FecCD family ABC transporter permease [Geomesophilobacter sediminis]|uniref:Iron ABC transporter permease n=1 Tax=Geomesophilobacter sediminis TaxID=2798584 RepID=A0A8J7LYL8_9BACT|nr:iron ABC transporter permease [Geomesophilobacter sediminis]MBJ6725062.1 iron ABC transporter permease [Geomesophilobacter sediminis]